MGAYQKLPIVFVKSEHSIVVARVHLRLFVLHKVLLYVFVNGQPAASYELVERQRVLCVINLVLQHGVEVLNIDVRILD